MVGYPNNILAGKRTYWETMLFSFTIFPFTNKDSSCYISTLLMSHIQWTPSTLYRSAKDVTTYRILSIWSHLNVWKKKKKDKLCFPNHYKSLLNLKNGQVAIFKKLFRREAPILGVLESVFNPIPSGTSDSKHLILNSCLLPYLSFFNLPPSYPS